MYKLMGTFSDKSIISKGTYLKTKPRTSYIMGYHWGLCVCVCVRGASDVSFTFSDASPLFMAIISVTAVPVERRSAQNVVITFRSAVERRGWVDYTLFGMIKQRSWTLSRLWRTWCGAQGSQSAVQTDEYGDKHTALVVTLSPEDNVSVAKRRSIVCMCRFHILRALCSAFLVLKCTRCLLICFPTRNVDSLNIGVLTLTSHLPITFLLWWTGSCASLPPTRWIMMLNGDCWICLKSWCGQRWSC